MTPEKLFANGPEWVDVSTRPGSVYWQSLFLNLEAELVPPGSSHDVKWVACIGGSSLNYFDTESDALAWLRARIIAHRDELLRIAPVDEWRGIETAPKDGTIILALTEDGGRTVYFHNGKWSYSEVFTCIVSPSPTHWLPLPEPPKL